MDEAVLQARVLVVDILERGHRLLQRVDLSTQASDPLRSEVPADASGNDRVHEVAVAERRRVGAQRVLAQGGELREPEREPRVVAEETQVPQVLSRALALEKQRAQPQRAR